MNVKKITLCAVFSTLSLALYGIESALPPPFPFIGAKLGLSNIVILYLVFNKDYAVKSAILVFMTRIALSAILFSGMFSLVFSFCGGISALAVEGFLAYISKQKNNLSAIIILAGVLAGIIHNIVQLFCAAFWLGGNGVFLFFPQLLICGAVAGLCSGLLVSQIIKRGTLPPS